MPNTGRPSRDCNLCRSRRVKCDLTKPACLRCATYGMPCPGYREEGLVFRNKGSAHFDKRRPCKAPTRPSLSPAASPVCTLSGKDTDPEQQPLALTTSSLLSAHPTDQAVALLLSRFRPATDVAASRSPLSFFPLLYRGISADSCLVLVSRALSEAYVTNQRGGRAPGDAYGRALRSVNGALGHPVESGSDATAMAVWLLNVYEVLVFVQPTPAPARAWDAHSAGLLSLLRHRGTAQLTTWRGRNIFWTMFGMIVIRYITATTACPPECRRWLDALQPLLHEAERHPFAVYTHLLDVSDLLPAILHAACEESAAAALDFVPSALRAVDAAERAFSPPRDASPTELHLWAIHRGVRIRLHHALVLLLLLAETAPGLPAASRRAMREHRAGCLVVIHEEARGVLGAVEEAMPDGGGGRAPSWLDALRVLWPLSVLATVATVPGGQREAAVGALARIKGGTGFQRVGLGRVEPVVVPAEVGRALGRDAMLERLLRG